MQRIALTADTHGNLPALEAVLDDIERRDLERIFCLDDLAGKGPNGAAVVDICRARCEVVILSNWDALLAQRQDTPVFQWRQQKLGAQRCVVGRSAIQP